MGIYRSEPQTTKYISEGSSDNLSFVAAQMQEAGEDKWRLPVFTKQILEMGIVYLQFLMVMEVFLNQYLNQIFIKVLRSTPQYMRKQYVEALDSAFRIVDQLIESEEGETKLKVIRDEYQMFSDKIGNWVGCTANVLLITSDQYFVANAGDSRSALYRNGKLITLSQDHKPINLIEQKRIHYAEGMATSHGRMNRCLNVSRSFGYFNCKQNKKLDYDQQIITCKPDIIQIFRQTSDEFILMGQDGIWQRFVENSFGLLEIVKAQLINKTPPKKLLEDLFDKLLAKDRREKIGCDNMSAILIMFK